MPIPKILHQLWIGPKERPSKFMDTMRDNNPDFEYIMWNEAELESRGLTLTCQARIDSMSEINGKADIIRWEILYKYGGIFVDADCLSVAPLGDDFAALSAFSNYENEQARPGLIAVGLMGFQPGHPFCRAAIDWILANNVSVEETGKRAWITVGPGLFTQLYNTGRFPDVKVFPSYYSLPEHYTGLKYAGHAKIYAFHEWGSTRKHYDTMNELSLPSEYTAPSKWVSVLVSSYNTNASYVAECLESIRSQEGHFGMELVWINDGSNELSTRLLEAALAKFQRTTRFCTVVYKKMDTNMGIAHCLNQGILMCSHEIVVKQDSDDIMLPHRIRTQLEFMDSHEDCVLLGSNVLMFTADGSFKKGLQHTRHPAELTWGQYKTTKSHWIMNHPSIMYKRSAVLAVGNYSFVRSIFEDFEVELKLLKRFGRLYNIQESLVLYRIHPDQVTSGGRTSTPENVAKRTAFIESLM